MIPLDAVELLKRFKRAQDRRNHSLWSHLQECYEYAAPQRETFFDYVEGQKKNTDIYDDTAIDGLQIFANRMQRAMVPPWQKWSLLVPGQELTTEQREQTVNYQGEEIKYSEALERVNDAVFNYIHRSNFSSRIYEAFIDFGISTGNITCEFDEKRDKLVFNTVPLSQAYFGAGPDGEISDHWRDQEVEYGMILQMWPKAVLDDHTKAKIEKTPRAKIRIVDGCVLIGDQYYYIVILKDKKVIIFSQDEEETSPFISFRGMVVPGEIWGRGPIMQKLTSIKTLNVIMEFDLTSAAISAAGMWTGRSDGIFNPYTMQVAPGIVIPVESNDRNNPTLAAAPLNFDWQYNAVVYENIKNSVNKALFAEPLGELDDPTKTATEMQLRYQMHMEDSGAFFSRVQTELIEKLMKRVLHVLKRAGKVPNIKIDGKNVELKHTSPIAKVMDQEDLRNLQAAIVEVSTLGEEAIPLTFKTEDVGPYIAEKRGVDASLLTTKAERKNIKDKMAKVAEAAIGGELGN